MTTIFRFASLLLLASTLFTTTSCKKDKEEVIIPLEQQLLTAKKWQVEEVSETQLGITRVTYKKGAPDNEDDFSMIRQHYKTDGTITYIDSFEEAGTDGRYQLMSHQQMQLSLGSLSTIVFDVVIRENSFSYKQEIQGGVLQFTFSPAQ